MHENLRVILDALLTEDPERDLRWVSYVDFKQFLYEETLKILLDAVDADSRLQQLSVQAKKNLIINLAENLRQGTVEQKIHLLQKQFNSLDDEHTELIITFINSRLELDEMSEKNWQEFAAQYQSENMQAEKSEILKELTEKIALLTDRYHAENDLAEKKKLHKLIEINNQHLEELSKNQNLKPKDVQVDITENIVHEIPKKHDLPEQEKWQKLQKLFSGQKRQLRASSSLPKILKE